MSKPTFLLHPGYGKTGTSTLQKSFFDPLSNLGRIHYFGMFLDAPKDHPDRVFFDQLQSAMYMSDAAFDSELPRLKAGLAAAASRSSTELPLVLSNEHFLLSSYSTREAGATIRVENTARRLALVLAGYDVRLLFGLRRQDEMMRALFVEAAARTNHQNSKYFQDLSAYISLCLKDGSVFNPMYNIDYSVGQYVDAFPDARTATYFYEGFVSQQQEMLETICDLLDMGISALDLIEQPLPNLNAKRKVNGGVEIGERSKAAKLLHAVPGGKALAGQLRQSSLLRGFNEKTRPKRKIENLTDEQSALIRSGFVTSNHQLALRFPHLQNALQQYGYLDRPVIDQEKRA